MVAKTIHGKPVYGEYGKVTRGKDYVPPNQRRLNEVQCIQPDR